MLVKSDLKLIAKNRLKDACVLMQHKRYSAALYLAGYMMELHLKLKICDLFGFKKGFPENDMEFNEYKKSLSIRAGDSIELTKLRQIKCHDLEKLLFYSGKQAFVYNNFPKEWGDIQNWGPEQRYAATVVRKAIAADFIKSCTTIIQNL